MKVWFKRTGGFAAISITVTLDTEMLPKVEGERLSGLIATASFFLQPNLFKSLVPGIDRFHYELKVEEAGRVKTIEMDESAVPDLIRPLLDYLIEMARAKRK